MAFSKYRLRPSSAWIWVECYAYVQMAERYPEPEGEEAREGTAAHWVWGIYKMRGTWPEPGDVADNGVIVDEEMIKHAKRFVALLDSWNVSYSIERSLPAPQIHMELGGTPDADAYDADNNILYVGDYKYGHEFVEVFRNWQLVCYVAALIEHYGILDPECEVVLQIYQPRNYDAASPLRVWRTDVGTIRKQFEMLKIASVRALSNNPGTKVGPHCLRCSGRHACSSLQRQTSQVFWLTDQMIPHDITPQAMSHEMMMLEELTTIIKARLSGLQEQAELLIRDRVNIPGYGLVPGRGKTVWDVDVKEIAALETLTGVKLTKKEAITPTQAVDKDIDAALISTYSKRIPGALKLGRVDFSKVFGAK